MKGQPSEIGCVGLWVGERMSRMPIPRQEGEES